MVNFYKSIHITIGPHNLMLVLRHTHCIAKSIFFDHVTIIIACTCTVYISNISGLHTDTDTDTDTDTHPRNYEGKVVNYGCYILLGIVKNMATNNYFVYIRDTLKIPEIFLHSDLYM